MNTLGEVTERVPIGWRWRSSAWFTTLIVGLGMFLKNFFTIFSYRMGIPGLTVDLLAYSIITPVMPFQLEKLGYSGVSARVGWLSFAYVCDSPSSGATILRSTVGRTRYLFVHVFFFLISFTPNSMQPQYLSLYFPSAIIPEEHL